MDVKKDVVGHMSNSEVMEFLQNTDYNFKRLHNFKIISTRVKTYLENELKWSKETENKIENKTEQSDLDKSMINDLNKDGKITKLEILQIINQRPISFLDLQLILENIENRFTEEEIETLILKIKNNYNL